MQENEGLDPSQITNSSQNITISIIQLPDHSENTQIPNLQLLQIFQQNQNESQLSQAVQQSLSQYQMQSLSRKNGLRKRHYRSVKKMKVGKTNQKCTICIQPFKKDQIINLLPCSHIIHIACCKQWTTFNHKCPVCRFNLTEYFKNLQLAQMEPKNHEHVQQMQQVIE